mmetsp:Transcript_27271/g.80208  ORF Transcript_27271/g.80208 Transcript_27271/m.80208 type:complete len:202 (+) Transcript_27271:279-884(+)
MTVTDSDTADSVVYDLSRYDWKGLHMLFQRLGFRLVDGAVLPENIQILPPITVSASQPTAHNDASSTKASNSPRRDVDTASLAPVLHEPSARAAEPRMSLRTAVQQAVATGDDVLTLGLMLHGSGGHSHLFHILACFAVVLLAVAAALALGYCRASTRNQLHPGSAFGALAEHRPPGLYNALANAEYVSVPSGRDMASKAV